MYLALAIILIAVVSAIAIRYNAEQLIYGQGNMTGNNVTAGNGNMTAGNDTNGSVSRLIGKVIDRDINTTVRYIISMYSAALLVGIVIPALGSMMIGAFLLSGVDQAYGQTNITDMTGANMSGTATNMTTSSNMTEGTEDVNTTKGSVSGVKKDGFFR